MSERRFSCWKARITSTVHFTIDGTPNRGERVMTRATVRQGSAPQQPQSLGCEFRGGPCRRGSHESQAVSTPMPESDRAALSVILQGSYLMVPILSPRQPTQKRRREKSFLMLRSRSSADHSVSPEGVTTTTLARAPPGDPTSAVRQS